MARLSTPFRTALLFVLFSLVWIAFSDQLVLALFDHPGDLTWLQTIKGGLYVVVAGALIYGVASQGMHQMADSERRHRLFFEENPLPMWIYDPDRRVILDANPTFCTVFGYDRTEMPESPIDSLFPSGSQELLDSAVALARAGQPNQGGIWWMLRKDGGVARVMLWAQTIVLDGRPVRLVAGQDITASARAQEELILANQRVRQATAELRELSHVAAHDLQEPVRQVVSYAQLLRKRYHGRLDAEANDYIDYVMEGAYRLRTLITDLMNFLNLEAAEPAPVDLDALVRSVTGSLRGEMDMVGGLVRQGPLPTVPGSEVQLQLLVRHLLDNCIKFRSPDRLLEVLITAERKPQNWILRFEDNGLGIPPENREIAFRLFGRLQNRSAAPGNGIGLALCRKVAELHGGTIQLENRPLGTSVAVILPHRPMP